MEWFFPMWFGAMLLLAGLLVGVALTLIIVLALARGHAAETSSAIAWPKRPRGTIQLDEERA